MEINNYREGFEKELNHLKEGLAQIRTGRASITLLDGIMVDAYDTKTPVPQVASITIPEPRTIVVQPWDKSIAKEVEKALSNSDLGLSVQNDGDVLRCKLPDLNEENRKKLVKVLGDKVEQARIRIRLIRDNVKDEIKESTIKREITEDDKYRLFEDLDNEVKGYNKKIEEMSSIKEEEIMTI